MHVEILTWQNDFVILVVYAKSRRGTRDIKNMPKENSVCDLVFIVNKYIRSTSVMIIHK